MNIDCYINSIGLARETCPCEAEGAPDGYTRSDSGLFLADLAPFSQLEGLESCEGEANPWTVMAQAREEAIRVFIADTNALMVRNNRLKREPYRGAIGEIESRDTDSFSEVYAGLRIACAPVRSGVLKISKIGALFNQTGSFTLKIFNNLNEQVGDDLTVDMESGKLKLTAVNLSLPLYNTFAVPLEYFFVYEQADTGSPRCTRVVCGGCTGYALEFNRAAPHYAPGFTGRKAWASWVMAGGWRGSTTDSFDIMNCPDSADRRTHGLMVEVSLQCDPGETLCSESLDFNGNPLAASMAYAIRYKAGEILADKLLRDGGLNRQTLINREELREAKKEWSAKYNEHTSYISSEADVRGGDCLDCRSLFDMKVAGILS
jgi:hypothetical protein